MSRIPQFTNEQSFDAVMAAINDVATGKPVEECNASALEALRVVKDSNSMIIAKEADKDIALQNALAAVEDKITGNQVGAPPIADDTDADDTDAVNDDTDGAEPVPF